MGSTAHACWPKPFSDWPIRHRTPAKAVLSLNAGELRVGARADLLVVDAADAEDLVAGGATGRTVFVAGLPVAGTLEATQFARHTGET